MVAFVNVILCYKVKKTYKYSKQKGCFRQLEADKNNQQEYYEPKSKTKKAKLPGTNTLD